jgi:hypothetical protein
MQGQVHTIFPLNMEKKFTEDQAIELINLFMAVTHKAKNTVQGLNSQLEYHKAQPHEANEIQQRLNTEIQKWSDKMRRLGGTPLALYKVKIPAAKGFFIWEFPAADIEYHI